jgi:uncharacterized protein YfdQ (DUF2303 family)
MKAHDILHNATLQTEAAVTAGLALALRDPESTRVIDNPHLPPVLVAQDQLTIVSLERFAPRPLRPEIHIALHTARDLHAYVIAQTVRPPSVTNLETSKLATGIRQLGDMPDQPVIFADRDTMTIKAFLDYHHAGNDARWLNHTAKVAFKNSHQFERWKKVNGQQMTQEQFALFLDEVINDITAPSGAEVLSFAENLEATSTQVFKAAVKLASGETNYTFTDARDGDISTAIIDRFTIGIPIWQGGEKVAIEARLFHRIVDNKDKDGAPNGTKSLRFWFTLRHLDEIIDTLFAEEVAFLRDAFENIAPIYSGTPPTKPETIPLGV